MNILATSEKQSHAVKKNSFRQKEEEKNHSVGLGCVSYVASDEMMSNQMRLRSWWKIDNGYRDTSSNSDLLNTELGGNV